MTGVFSGSAYLCDLGEVEDFNVSQECFEKQSITMQYHRQNQ